MNRRGFFGRLLGLAGAAAVPAVAKAPAVPHVLKFAETFGSPRGQWIAQFISGPVKVKVQV